MPTNRLRTAGRRTLVALGCFAALALSASCSDFLDPKPNDVLAPQNFYRSAEDAVSAVNAVYAQTQWVYFYYFYESDMASDDALASPNFGTDGHQLASYTFDPTLWSLDNEWSNAYITINRANIVLDRVPGIAMDTTLRARVLGEAHFLRALMYFELARMFGGVPLMEHEVASVAESQVPRADTSAVFALITSDLQSAVQELPLSYSAADEGRATRGAAAALLAKVYLYRKEYNNAAKYAGMVMQAPFSYSLNADFRDNFRIALENTNPESIFEIQYGAPEQTPGVVGSIHTLFTLPAGFPGGDAYGLIQVSPELVALYGPNDQRGNHATIMEPWHTNAAGDSVPGYLTLKGDSVTWGVPNGVAFHKWLDETNTKDMTARSWQQQPNNWIILRYADVLLMYAEAVNEGGTPTAGSAEAALNQVRARAGIPTVAGLSQALLRDSIRVERRREFAFEGQRWFDLSRWGLLDSTIKAKTANMQVWQPNETTEHGVTSPYFPIPQSEINNNHLLTQNPGW